MTPSSLSLEALGVRVPMPTSEPVVGVRLPVLAVGVVIKTVSLELLDLLLADGVAKKSLSSVVVNSLPSGVRKTPLRTVDARSRISLAWLSLMDKRSKFMSSIDAESSGAMEALEDPAIVEVGKWSAYSGFVMRRSLS
jgi:hypothetical protein